MSATTEALLVTASLLGMSLVSAYITLVLMRGSAQVVHKGVRLGGATGMFVVTFVMLSQFLPDIRDGLVSEVQAATQMIDLTEKYNNTKPVLLALSPTAQATTAIDLARLSYNEYVVNNDLGIAIARPTVPSWEAGIFDEGIESIDLTQLPMFALALEGMKSLSAYAVVENKVFGVRSVKAYDLVD